MALMSFMIRRRRLLTRLTGVDIMMEFLSTCHTRLRVAWTSDKLAMPVEFCIYGDEKRRKTF